jgi:hypothetical protein
MEDTKKLQEQRMYFQQMNAAIAEDELQEFLDEYSEVLKDVGLMKHLIGSAYTTPFHYSRSSVDAYLINANNQLIYIIEADGDFADSDMGGMTVLDRNASIPDLIDDFKSKCNDVYLMDGDFSVDQLEDAGSSLGFTEQGREGWI